jgi:hypothetical protein
MIWRNNSNRFLNIFINIYINMLSEKAKNNLLGFPNEASQDFLDSILAR